MNALMLKHTLPVPRTAPVKRGTAKPWHSLTVEAVLSELDVQTGGLTTSRANQLERFGRNEIARRKGISPLRLFLKQFASFFVVVLLFAAAGLRSQLSTRRGRPPPDCILHPGHRGN